MTNLLLSYVCHTLIKQYTTKGKTMGKVIEVIDSEIAALEEKLINYRNQWEYASDHNQPVINISQLINDALIAQLTLENLKQLLLAKDIK